MGCSGSKEGGVPGRVVLGVLLSDGEEKASVVSAFKKTAKEFEVVSVERIENPALRSAYDLKREQMASANGVSTGSTERAWVFHGTNENTAKKIAESGFKMGGLPDGAGEYGQGIYFARDAAYSTNTSFAQPNADGIQHMFLVRAAVGEYCVGKRGAESPDARPDGRPFDSTVDDVENPWSFVTYDEAQQVPECVIRFQLGLWSAGVALGSTHLIERAAVVGACVLDHTPALRLERVLASSLVGAPACRQPDTFGCGFRVFMRGVTET